ncbi:MAG: hypothetical protein DME19_09185 [Verrucomicrobia bacterium]|nr:MAG: hypothetical protein DME19_09185 [Verrucomicrobiota bacterium]
MKRLISSLVCLAVGIGIGWYFGYTRPALRMQHLYQDVQKTTGLSDAEMVKQLPESLAVIKREDESVAMVALRAIEILDRGDAQAAKKHLAYWVGSYYRVYHANGDTNLISRIERAATTNAEIAAEIAKKIQ